MCSTEAGCEREPSLAAAQDDQSTVQSSEQDAGCLRAHRPVGTISPHSASHLPHTLDCFYAWGPFGLTHYTFRKP